MSTDYYKERVEEVCEGIVSMYEHAIGALEAVEPEALELLTLERQELLGAWRELSVESFFGRAEEAWLQQASARIRQAEQAFERKLLEEFDAQRQQMGEMQKNRKARRAYHSAA